MDIFQPRKVLTQHLQKLVDEKVLRGVGQANDFAGVMEGVQPNHLFVYVTYDNYSNVSTKTMSQSMTQSYTLYLAYENHRPARSGGGHGMDDAGEVLSQIMLHVQGLSVKGDKPTPGMSKRFVLAAPSEPTRYRQGWAFYPISFSIDIINRNPINS